jgi:hypothetical protein
VRDYACAYAYALCAGERTLPRRVDGAVKDTAHKEHATHPYKGLNWALMGYADCEKVCKGRVRGGSRTRRIDE